MHPTDWTIAALLLALGLSWWRIAWDARRLSDANCGRQGAEMKAALLKADNERLQGVIAEGRICPGQCFNRSLENFAREIDRATQQAAEALRCLRFDLPGVSTLGRCDAGKQEKANHEGTKNTKGGTGNADTQ